MRSVVTNALGLAELPGSRAEKAAVRGLPGLAAAEETQRSFWGERHGREVGSWDPVEKDMFRQEEDFASSHSGPRLTPMP